MSNKNNFIRQFDLVKLLLNEDIVLKSLNGNIVTIKKGNYFFQIIDIYSIDNIKYYVLDLDETGQDFLEYISDGGDIEKLI
jgi:hypothetical protein